MDPTIESDWLGCKKDPIEEPKNNVGNIARSWQWRERGVDPRSYTSNKTVLENVAEDILVQKPLKIRCCDLPGSPRSTFLMVFSPDGTKVASTHGNHNVYVSELASGKHVRVLQGHPRTPWCIAFHPSHTQLIGSGCLGGQVRVWDISSGGSEVWYVPNQTVISSIAFHPRVQLLVVATYNELYFWDWSKSAPFTKVSTNNLNEKVRYVAFDALGYKLITGISSRNTSVPNIPPLFEQTPPPRSPQLFTFRRARRDEPDDSPSPNGQEYPIPGTTQEVIVNSYHSLVQRYDSLVRSYQRLFMFRHRMSVTPPPPATTDRGTDPMEVDLSPDTSTVTRTARGQTSTQSSITPSTGDNPTPGTSRRQDDIENEADGSNSRLLNLDVLSFNNNPNTNHNLSQHYSSFGSRPSAFQPLSESAERTFRAVDQSGRTRLLPNPFSSTTGTTIPSRLSFGSPVIQRNSENTSNTSRTSIFPGYRTDSLVDLSPRRRRLIPLRLQMSFRNSQSERNSSGTSNNERNGSATSNNERNSSATSNNERNSSATSANERNTFSNSNNERMSSTISNERNSNTTSHNERNSSSLNDTATQSETLPPNNESATNAGQESPRFSAFDLLTAPEDSQSINESLDLIRDILRDSGSRLVDLITRVSLSTLVGVGREDNLPNNSDDSDMDDTQDPLRVELSSTSSDSDSDSLEVNIFRTPNATFREEDARNEDRSDPSENSNSVNSSDRPSNARDRIVIDLNSEPRNESRSIDIGGFIVPSDSPWFYMHPDSAGPNTSTSADDRRNNTGSASTDRNNAGSSSGDRNNAGTSTSERRNNVGSTADDRRNSVGTSGGDRRNNAGNSASGRRNNVDISAEDRRNIADRLSGDSSYARSPSGDRNNAGISSSDISNPSRASAERTSAGSSSADRNNAGTSSDSRRTSDSQPSYNSDFNPNRPSTSRENIWPRNRGSVSEEIYRKVRAGVIALQKHTIQLTDMWLHGNTISLRELRIMWENLRRRILTIHRETNRQETPSYYTRSLLERCRTLNEMTEVSSRTSGRNPRRMEERSRTSGARQNTVESNESTSNENRSSEREDRRSQTRSPLRRSPSVRSSPPFRRRLLPNGSLFRWRPEDDLRRRSRIAASNRLSQRYSNRSRRDYARAIEIAATRHEIRMRAMQVLSVMFNSMMMCLEERGLSQVIINMLRLLKKALALTCLMLMTTRESARTGRDPSNQNQRVDSLNVIRIQNIDHTGPINVDGPEDSHSNTTANDAKVDRSTQDNDDDKALEEKILACYRQPSTSTGITGNFEPPLLSPSTQRWSNRLAVQIAAANRNTSVTARNRRDLYMESRRQKALHRTNPTAHPLIKKRILPPVTTHRIPALRLPNTSFFNKYALPRTQPSRNTERNTASTGESANSSNAQQASSSRLPPDVIDEFEQRINLIRLAHMQAVRLRNAARNRFRRLQTIRLYTPSSVREMFTLQHVNNPENQQENRPAAQNESEQSNTRRGSFGTFDFRTGVLTRDRAFPRSSDETQFHTVFNNVAMPLMHVNDLPTNEVEGPQPQRPPRIHEYLQPIILAQNAMVVDEDGNGEGEMERGNNGGGGAGGDGGGAGQRRLNSIANLLDAGIISEAFPAPSHRIQAWDFTTGDTPDISNSTKNVVVAKCRIHNDASIDISKDGRILVALHPVPRLRTNNHWLGVYSLEWSRLGQCLHTAALEQSAVSVALSPTARHLAVGLGSRRFSSAPHAPHARNVFALLYRLDTAENSTRTGLSPVKELEQNWEHGFRSLNCLRWAPQPGQGFVYANNTGQLLIMS